MKIIHQDCDPTLSEDRSLPYTAYLIEYRVEGIVHFDITMANKKVEIFDHYYDKYKKDFINMTQSEGRMNPKLWGVTSKEKKKK